MNTSFNLANSVAKIWPPASLSAAYERSPHFIGGIILTP